MLCRDNETMNALPIKTVLLAGLLLVVGCARQETVIPAKRPRPVKVEVLRKQRPPRGSLVSASVACWKQEQVGFEVGGRVESVVEPNTEIKGRVHKENGEVMFVGTPIAVIENERYRLQVQKATADVTRAEQTLIAAQTEANESIPAQIAAAEASRDLAKIEFERSERLFARNAGAKGDVDRDKANYQNASSQLKQLDAAMKAKQAEIESLRNAVLQAKQALRDAQRNLEDCVLYSSFQGEISEVSVVPGSVVAAGQPVATLQMMNPIKLELEVSAEDSRRLQENDILPIEISMPDGSIKHHQGYLYLIDPVADTRTRTFTVTLLVKNEPLSEKNIEGAIAKTDEIMRLDFEFLPGAEKGMLFASERALFEDEEGPFVWRITNATPQSRGPADHIFKVQKLRVKFGPLRVPYLGNWMFQQVLVDDPDFDGSNNLIVSSLTIADDGDPAEWNGDTVVLDTGGQWMLRPGDLVKVDLTGEDSSSGYYVPMDAIARNGDESFIFTVHESDKKSIAKRLPVKLVGDEGRTITSSLRRVEPLGQSSLDGVAFVTQGAHYLIDGEEVNALTGEESN